MWGALEWVFGFLCVGVVFAKVVGLAWCLVELRRKWRDVPELWGIDWLDIVYRIEREFGVELSATDFTNWSAAARTGLTAGQLRELIAGKLRAAGADEPPDAWPRLVSLLGEALNTRPRRVTADSRLYGDLGMIHGLE